MTGALRILDRGSERRAQCGYILRLELHRRVLFFYIREGRRAAMGRRETVRCSECSADVSALREFCPICGAAMDPGVRGSFLRGTGGRTADGRGRGGAPGGALGRHHVALEPGRWRFGPARQTQPQTRRHRLGLSWKHHRISSLQAGPDAAGPVVVLPLPRCYKGGRAPVRHSGPLSRPI